MNRILIAATALLALGGTAASARPLTAHDLASLRRVSAPVVSPDGKRVVWQQRETDWTANKGVNALWQLDLIAKAAKPMKIAAGGTEPWFSRDGALWFLAGGRVQRMAPGAAAATVLASEVDGFLPSPAGDKLLVWKSARTGATSLMTSEDKTAKGSGRTYDRLFVRHWDAWADDTRNRLFVLPVTGGRAGTAVSLTPDIDGDAPGKPFGGREELAWSADGRTIYFTLREAGRIEATSTNLDVWQVCADGSAAPVNLTAANLATDTLPAISPDGRTLAYVAMARAGYESDRQVVQLRDLATGRVRPLTQGWDRSVESIAWTADGRSLLVTAQDELDKPLFRVDVANGRVTRLTRDGSVSAAWQIGRTGQVLVARDSSTAPSDLYRLTAEGGEGSRLTAVNADLLAGIELPTVERFRFAGAGGDAVTGMVFRPAGLAADGKVPVALLIHGGPQGSFGSSWSYRWNPALFASAGYGTVTIDFHGSTGHGQAFTDAIREEWGGKPLDDLKAGLAAATRQFPWLDGERACALGGSYGGYMTNWIAGNWPDRFRCLVTHAGVFDARAMAYETEELWFDEWEHGGKAYHEAPRAYERWNPVNHVDKWKTPMLVIHGEKDFRIPYSQGLAVFTALQRREVPSRLVMFPDENHWILKPRNSEQWYREVFDWMGRWTAK